tara:strand:+ start:165 stop:560 length:396 start_codon:yes stop_codon:yes gene_type:complete
MLNLLSHAKDRCRSRRIIAVAFLGAAVILAWGRPLHAGALTHQRGEFIPPGSVAASIVKLCGLAVVLVVQPHEGKATLYAGDAMRDKMKELALVDDSAPAYELAELYEPIESSCRQIHANHEQLKRTQVKD